MKKTNNTAFSLTWVQSM